MTSETTGQPVSLRPLSEIAAEIRADMERLPINGNVRMWTRPYLDAMATLNTMADRYMLDDAVTIVRYFLSNASNWRGDVARRIKAELKAMLPSARGR